MIDNSYTIILVLAFLIIILCFIGCLYFSYRYITNSADNNFRHRQVTLIEMSLSTRRIQPLNDLAIVV